MKARFVQATAILWACISLSACFENSQEAETFDRVVVTFPQVVEDYGAVATGSASAYHEVSEAYSLAMIDAYYGDQTLHIQPIDHTGETALSAGLYTYTLFMMDDEQLTMSMSRD
jgi:hypothetical protein